jgi:spermidine synthase
MTRVGVTALVAGVVLMGLVGLLAVGKAGEAGEAVVKYDRESRYYRIRVVDYPEEGRRCLHFAKTRGIQSSMILQDPTKLDLRYSRSMMASMAFVPEAKDVLLVGLGGAAIPKFIQKQFPDVRIDIVEVDADVVKVCQEFFEFKGTPNTHVIVMDGRMFFKRSQKKYDLILLDAYAADHVPFHLTTREFVQLVKDHLNPGGLVASNLWEQSVNRFYYAELKTFQDAFPQTYRFPSGDSGNVIVFASLDKTAITPAELRERAKKIVKDRDFGFDLTALIEKEYNLYTGQTNNEKPLTDDMAPVDTLRRENPKFFEEEAKRP